MLVLSDRELTERSTKAAREYVLVARGRLEAELARLGDAARTRPSFQRLERSISPDELLNIWPGANLAVVLAE